MSKGQKLLAAIVLALLGIWGTLEANRSYWYPAETVPAAEEITTDAAGTLTPLDTGSGV